MLRGGHGRRGRWFAALLTAGIVAGLTALPSADAAPNPPPTPAAQNGRFTFDGKAPLPGRGLSVSWSPDGKAIAAGGRFRDKVTKQRYDTRTIDVTSKTLQKSFNCHHFWTVAHTWVNNPFLGNIIVDGGGDHAVKIWNANGSGGKTCKTLGQLPANEGGIAQLGKIPGWTMALSVSPDGRFLMGADRSGIVRLWQLAPGANRFKVVKIWYDETAGNLLSARWAKDGRRLIVGDRNGKVSEWSFDPARDLWNDATIAEFAKMGYEPQVGWSKRNLALVTPTVLWSEGGHKQVWSVRYSPDGNRVAAAGTDGYMSVYEARTGRVLYRVTGDVAGTVRRPKRVPLYSLDWSPDGALIAVGTGNDKIHIFNASNGSSYDTLVGHLEVVTDVAWSPDGKTLASTASGQKLSMALLESTVGPDNFVHFWKRK